MNYILYAFPLSYAPGLLIIFVPVTFYGRIERDY